MTERWGILCKELETGRAYNMNNIIILIYNNKCKKLLENLKKAETRWRS
jgi:hypothetical protein